MAPSRNPCFLPEAATTVVSTARGLRREIPEDDLSVNAAWIQMTDGPWEVQQRRACTMALVVSLRNAHGASSTTVSWPNPAAYSPHEHQLPAVRQGPGLTTLPLTPRRTSGPTHTWGTDHFGLWSLGCTIP